MSSVKCAVDEGTVEGTQESRCRMQPMPSVPWDINHFCFSTINGEQPFLPLLLMRLMRINEIICSLSLRRKLSG